MWRLGFAARATLRASSGMVPGCVAGVPFSTTHVVRKGKGKVTTAAAAAAKGGPKGAKGRPPRAAAMPGATMVRTKATPGGAEEEVAPHGEADDARPADVTSTVGEAAGVPAAGSRSVAVVADSASLLEPPAMDDADLLDGDPTLIGPSLSWTDIHAQLQAFMAEAADSGGAGSGGSFKALQKARLYLKEHDAVATLRTVEDAMECMHSLQRLGFPQRSLFESRLVTAVASMAKDLDADGFALLCRYAESAVTTESTSSTSGSGSGSGGGIEPWVRLLVHDVVGQRLDVVLPVMSLPQLTLLLRVLRAAGGCAVAGTPRFEALTRAAASQLGARLRQKMTLSDIAAAWFHGGSMQTLAELDGAALSALSESPVVGTEAPASGAAAALGDLLRAINHTTKTCSSECHDAIIAQIHRGVVNGEIGVVALAELIQLLAPQLRDTVPQRVIDMVRHLTSNPASLDGAELSAIMHATGAIGYSDSALIDEATARAARITAEMRATPESSQPPRTAAGPDATAAPACDRVAELSRILRTLGSMKVRQPIIDAIGAFSPDHLRDTAAPATLVDLAEALCAANVFPQVLVHAMARRAVEVRSLFSVADCAILLYSAAQTSMPDELRDDLFVQLLSRVIAITKFGSTSARFAGSLRSLSGSSGAGDSGASSATPQDVALLLRAVEAARFKVEPGSKVHAFLTNSASTVLTEFSTRELISLLLVAHSLRLGIGNALVKGLVQQLKRHAHTMPPRDAADALEAMQLVDVRDLEAAQLLTQQVAAASPAAPGTGELLTRVASVLMRLRFRAVWEASPLRGRILDSSPGALVGAAAPGRDAEGRGLLPEGSNAAALPGDFGILVYLAPPADHAAATAQVLKTAAEAGRQAKEAAPDAAAPRSNRLGMISPRSLLFLLASCGDAGELAEFAAELERRVDERRAVMQRDLAHASASSPISRAIPATAAAKSLVGDAPLPPCLAPALLRVFATVALPAALAAAAAEGSKRRTAFTDAAAKDAFLTRIATVQGCAAPAFEALHPSDVRELFVHLRTIIDAAGVPHAVFRQLGRPLAEISVSLTGEETVRILDVYRHCRIRDDRVLRALFAQCFVHRQVILSSPPLLEMVRAALAEYGGHWAGPLAKAAAKGASAAAAGRRKGGAAVAAAVAPAGDAATARQ